MSDQPQATQPASPAAEAQPAEPAPEAATEKSGPGAARMLMLVLGGFMGLIVVGFLLTVALAFFAPGAANGVQMIRDFFIIAMALEGMLIGGALVILVLQLSQLINLLQNEVKPILEQTNETVKTVRGTATFVSRNVADPVIRASGFMAWLMRVLLELFSLGRIGRRRNGRAAAVSAESPAEGGD